MNFINKLVMKTFYLVLRSQHEISSREINEQLVFISPCQQSDTNSLEKAPLQIFGSNESKLPTSILHKQLMPSEQSVINTNRVIMRKKSALKFSLRTLLFDDSTIEIAKEPQNRR